MGKGTASSPPSRKSTKPVTARRAASEMAALMHRKVAKTQAMKEKTNQGAKRR